jgi:hypothetical protein
MSSSAGAASSSTAAPAQPIALLAEDAAARAPYVPIAYGTISFWLGKKPGSTENQHRWTVYVRSPDGQHLGYAIEKVVFQLHPTFAVPKRGKWQFGVIVSPQRRWPCALVRSAASARIRRLLPCLLLSQRSWSRPSR